MSVTLTFPDVTPAQFQQLQAAAQKDGIAIIAAQGTVQAHGCTVFYHYTGWSGCSGADLILTLLHAPFMCGGIALGKLHDLVEGVLNPQPPVSPAESSSQ